MANLGGGTVKCDAGEEKVRKWEFKKRRKKDKIRRWRVRERTRSKIRVEERNIRSYFGMREVSKRV